MQLTAQPGSFLGVCLGSVINERENFRAVDVQIEKKFCFVAVSRKKDIVGDFLLFQNLLVITFLIPFIFMDEIAHEKELEKTESQDVGQQRVMFLTAVALKDRVED